MDRIRPLIKILRRLAENRGYTPAPAGWGGRVPLDGVSSGQFDVTTLGPSWGNVYGNPKPMTPDEVSALGNYADQTSARLFEPAPMTGPKAHSIPVYKDGRRIGHRLATFSEKAAIDAANYSELRQHLRDKFRAEQAFVRNSRAAHKNHHDLLLAEAERQKAARAAAASEPARDWRESVQRASKQKWGW